MSKPTTKAKGRKTKMVQWLGTQSGLRWETIRRYAKSDLLERGDDDRPIYMHRANCPSFCDFACNGNHGAKIATDVDTYEGNLSDG